jgi:hypothetical protein
MSHDEHFSLAEDVGWGASTLKQSSCDKCSPENTATYCKNVTF